MTFINMVGPLLLFFLFVASVVTLTLLWKNKNTYQKRYKEFLDQKIRVENALKNGRKKHG